MKYTIKPTNQFKKDLKRMQKQHKSLDLLRDVLKLLADGSKTVCLFFAAPLALKVSTC